MKIQVTQEDIDNGVPVRAWKCPIALAANRATGKICCVFYDISVYEGVPVYNDCTVTNQEDLVFISEAHLPDDVFHKLEVYDLHPELMKPFEFEVDLLC